MPGAVGPGSYLVFFMIFIIFILCNADLSSDNRTLLAFKASVDMNGTLNGWSQGSPCDGNWYGITCQDGRVARLVLEHLGLTGPITVLGSLDQLRVLSLMGNSLNGGLPDMSNWTNLKLLYLNENNFRGEIPLSISTLVHVLRLDMSNNELIGPIPDSLNLLTRLVTLRLENNFLSGTIPPLNLTTLTDFNVSGNELSGRIPITLRNFDISSFEGNPELCGYPVSACNLSLPPISPIDVQPPSPSILPCSPNSNPIPQRSKKASGSKLSGGVIAAIVVGDVFVLLFVIIILLFYYWKRYIQRLDKTNSKSLESEKGDFSPDQQSVQVPEVRKSKLVFFDWKKPMFDLEDLLRASAEMLGKGSLGTAYRAVLEDGAVVAVKRLKEVNVSGRKEFEQQMELIGNTQHVHLVHLRAYYYAKDEKLLVYDYLPNGSLYSLLHGQSVEEDESTTEPDPDSSEDERPNFEDIARVTGSLNKVLAASGFTNEKQKVLEEYIEESKWRHTYQHVTDEENTASSVSDTLEAEEEVENRDVFDINIENTSVELNFIHAVNFFALCCIKLGSQFYLQHALFMERLFRKHNAFTATFFEDVLVYSQNEKEDMQHLQIVFDALQRECSFYK